MAEPACLEPSIGPEPNAILDKINSCGLQDRNDGRDIGGYRLPLPFFEMSNGPEAHT